MREALAKADQFGRAYGERKQELKVKYGKENARRADKRQPMMTPSEIDVTIGGDAQVKDAFGAQQWWRAEAVMLADVLRAEVALAEFELREGVARARGI